MRGRLGIGGGVGDQEQVPGVNHTAGNRGEDRGSIGERLNHVRITAAGRGGRIAGRQAEVILSRDVIAHARSCWKCRDLSSVNIVAGSTVLMRTVVQHGDRVGDTPDNIGQRGRGDAMAIRDARGHPHADGGRWRRRIDCGAADGRCGDVGR